MSLLKKTGFIPGFFLLLVACSDNNKNTSEKPDPLADFDTLRVKAGSVLTADRYRLYIDKNDILKLGKRTYLFNTSEMQTGVKTSYAIDSGTLIYNKKYFTVTCFLDARKILTPVPSETKTLELKTPAYLLRGNKPYVTITYKGNFYPREQNPTASCYLHLNDSIALLNDALNEIKMKDQIVSAIHTHSCLDGLKWKLFEPSNEYSLKKDSILLDIELSFEKIPKKKVKTDQE